MSLFEPVFSALNAAEARYVAVGGLATVLHGFARLTADIDLVVDLDPDQARRLIGALSGLGFKPRAPVDAMAFADPAVRATWISEKGMRVFSLWDPQNPMREVDLFVENPIPFASLWQDSKLVVLASTEIRIASIPHLIALKRLAGRPQDIQDIEALEAILSRSAT